MGGASSKAITTNENNQTIKIIKDTKTALTC